jgi:hypothetical protein
VKSEGSNENGRGAVNFTLIRDLKNMDSMNDSNVHFLSFWRWREERSSSSDVK